MLKYYSSHIFLITGLTHIFCCGFPVLLSTNTVFVNILFSGSLITNFEWLEVLEVYLFVFSTLIILFLISLEVYQRKIKRVNQFFSLKANDDKRQKKIKFNIIFSSALYIFNSTLFLPENLL